MITVIAHFNKGSARPFPSLMSGVAGEGSVFLNPGFEGGVIVVSYDTDDENRLLRAYETHLADNDLSAFAMQRVGEFEFFYSKTNRHIF